LLDLIGWLATAISTSSYLCKRPVTLRRTQAVAALVWIGYGSVIRSFPLIAANVIVGFAAAYTSLRPDLDLQTHNYVKVEESVISARESAAEE